MFRPFMRPCANLEARLKTRSALLILAVNLVLFAAMPGPAKSRTQGVKKTPVPPVRVVDFIELPAYVPPSRAGVSFLPATGAALRAEANTLRPIFKAGARQHWQRAKRLSKAVKAPLARKLAQWYLVYGNRHQSDFSTIRGFLQDHPDWPGQRRLHRRAEYALARSQDDNKALRWFQKNPPKSGRGRLRYGEALLAKGRQKTAVRWLRKAWIENNFSRQHRRKILAKHKRHLTAAHGPRLDRLFWQGRLKAVPQLFPVLADPARRLAKARYALARRRTTPGKALARVPQRLRSDSGLLYERLRWQRRQRKYEAASRLLLGNVPVLPKAAQKWWIERRILARHALLRGDTELAYKLASGHRQTPDGGQYIQAEWMAGWIALRYRNDPNRAQRHFSRFMEKVKYPVSRARGAYWLARAAAAMGDAERAVSWHKMAAALPFTYYGQLSAEALGWQSGWQVGALAIPSKAAVEKFADDEMVGAVRLLSLLNRRDLMPPFLGQLARAAATPERFQLVARLALQAGRPDMAVRTAKLAARAGNSLGDAGYPRVAIPAVRSEVALTHALIRQESEFRANAVSHAGARGMMQLMPRTARNVAQDLGLSYSKNLLLKPDYNIALGHSHLSDLIEDYGGSYLLAVAAYNAGSHRINRWIKLFGDPRDMDVDVVDWIESIPFSETRNYVQRVMENLQIYRLSLHIRESGLTLMADLMRGQADAGR